MDIIDILTLIGGLALFLFGMNVMGEALEKKAGGKLKSILSSITGNPIKGFLLGLGVTAVIQSSSATTVMVVGFVNSGMLTLRQAINVIMGANVGTTVTAWLLSLTGISGDSFFIQLLKPSSFTPVLAVIGVVFCLFLKNPKKKDTGMILLGFAVLMFGMETMSDAVSGLKDVPAFGQMLVMFSNPFFGVLAGALLTAIIQSSSASVGILQALSATGAVTYGAAIPIIMGQNIGTCVTAMLSPIGTNKNARRAAVIHLSFNVIGTVVLLSLFYILHAIIGFAFLTFPIDAAGIALVHTSFNVLCTAMLLPCGKLLAKLSFLIIPDKKGEGEEKHTLLEERLFATPTIAVEQAHLVASNMVRISVSQFEESLTLLTDYSDEGAAKVRHDEDEVDRYEDELGTYLVHLAGHDMRVEDSDRVSMMLNLIGDFERISDHAVNIVESAEELRKKGLTFSDTAWRELGVMEDAVREILSLARDAFCTQDLGKAALVEPLEQVIDRLRDLIKESHIERLQKNECSIEQGFILSDILTNLERAADHCSNIAGRLIEITKKEMDVHRYLEGIRQDSEEFRRDYQTFAAKYSLP